MTQKTKKKVLITEDDLVLADVIANKLRLDGFDVVTAADGQKAVDLLLKESFDVVLLDLTMPWFDGFHVLEELKAKKVKTPVIIMSNLAQPEDIQRAKALGARNYLVKTSVTPVDIVREINSCLLKGDC